MTYSKGHSQRDWYIHKCHHLHVCCLTWDTHTKPRVRVVLGRPVHALHLASEAVIPYPQQLAVVCQARGRAAGARLILMDQQFPVYPDSNTTSSDPLPSSAEIVPHADTHTYTQPDTHLHCCLPDLVPNHESPHWCQPSLADSSTLALPPSFMATQPSWLPAASPDQSTCGCWPHQRDGSVSAVQAK